jgi:hypothetical protein
VAPADINTRTTPSALFGPFVTDPLVKYALPTSAIKSLSQPSGPTPAIFDNREAKEELEFSRQCESFLTTGFRGEYPVPLFMPFWRQPIKPNSKSDLPGDFQFATEVADGFDSTVTDTRTKQKAYIGRLWSSPVYLYELDTVRSAFAKRSWYDGLKFPLHRSALEITGNRPRNAGVEQLFRLLTTFLDRWSLWGLMTWDLPYPQGPLDGNPFPDGSRALPVAGVRTFVPTYFPVDKPARLRDAILSQQLTEARRMGLPPELASIGEVKKYAAVAELIHLERTIRSRRPNMQRKGIVAHIELAGMKHLGLKIDRIQGLRKLISKARKGFVGLGPPHECR